MTHSIHDRVAHARTANVWADVGRACFQALDENREDLDRAALIELASVCAEECDRALLDARCLREEMEV